MFEVKDKDLAGRIGRLEIGGYTVETPTIMPVINPNIQTIQPSELPEFGAQIAITNSYIIYKNPELRKKALRDGLKSVVDFPGPLMTDSGSFQLGVYGDIDVEPEEILKFQMSIGSDLLTPIDLPTAPGTDREEAARELDITTERIERAVEAAGSRAVAPVQGSTHPDLRREAAERVAATGAQYFCMGAIVPMMERYHYETLVDTIMAARKGLPEDKPIHFFGAGHPSFFALAVAMGADLFDSAAYALFAKEGRYLTVEGTRFLEEMEYLPCACPSCSRSEPGDMSQDDLARHNLHATFREIRTVKQAIREGRLTELVSQRARSHPHLLAGWRRFFDHVDWVEERDPAVKRKGMLFTGDETARRPEVARHNRRLDRVELGKRVLFAPGTADTTDLEETYDVVKVKPPFVYPVALRETYPCGQSVTPGDPYPWTLREAQRAVNRLLEFRDFDEIAYVDFPYGLEIPGGTAIERPD